MSLLKDPDILQTCVTHIDRAERPSPETAVHPPAKVTAHLDSHADTCAFGSNCFVLLSYSESVDVSSFHLPMKSLTNVCIACFTVAFDHDCISSLADN